MVKHFFLSTALTAVAAGLAAGQAPKPAVPPAPAPQAAPAPAAAPAKPEEPMPIFGIPKGYRYNPQGRRDPFVNPIPKEPPKPPDADKTKPQQINIPKPPGVPGMLVDETKIVGIVISRDPRMTKGFLQGADGKLFTVVTGTALYDGVIKEIRPESIVFSRINPVDKQPVNPIKEVERRVRPTSGENK